jgi:phosphotransferase system, enzyme I, PtsP
LKIIRILQIDYLKFNLYIIIMGDSDSNLDLVCTIGELIELFAQKTDVPGLLDKVVQLVANHMDTQVCSIYLFDGNDETLKLSATVGLRRESVNTVCLRLGEGIAGTALETMQTIRADEGSDHPQFKYIQKTAEDPYHAFLAVPIKRGNIRVGVFTLQHEKVGHFSEQDARALEVIASQLATTLENAKLLIDIHEEPSYKPKKIVRTSESVIHGITGNEGLAIGKSLFLGKPADNWLEKLTNDHYHTSLADFHQAVSQTTEQLKSLQLELEDRLADVASLIFSAHLMILQDEAFTGTMVRRIDSGDAPADAVQNVVNEFIDIFGKSPNLRIQEKIQDVKDVGYRLLRNLSSGDDYQDDYEGMIIIAEELLPSEMVKITSQKANAIILHSGGETAHITILAKSLNIPLVISDHPVFPELDNGTDLIVDATQGTILVSPSNEVMRKYRYILDTARPEEPEPADLEPVTFTADNHDVQVLANVNLLSDAAEAVRMGAAGVGLYRSEIPFIIRNDPPTEEEQYNIYRRLCETLAGRFVVLRTLDVGGDKVFAVDKHTPEANPFLGLRSIRFTFKYPHIFREQLRAMLRAGAGYPLKIMFPLITSIDDFLKAKRKTIDVMHELEREQVPFNRAPRFGAMVETPAIVEVIADLAREADFLSIGSNDLVQYMLGVDRTNEQVAEWYVNYHPAILRSVKRITTAADEVGCELSICGDMAGSIEMLPFLLGAGLRIFSVNPRLIPRVRRFLASLNMTKAAAFADELLALSTIQAVKERLEQWEEA